MTLRAEILYSKEAFYKLVKAKRDLGLTYRKIAQDFSGKNIVCKTGKWHPMMIKMILEFF